jgi:rod shape-determining protein MreC
MVADHNSPLLRPLRSVLGTLATPVFTVAEGPYAALETLSAWVFLRRENVLLEQEVLQLSVEQLRLRALEEENDRLRDLLGSAGQVTGRMLYAEVVGISPDPLRSQLLLDKGQADGVRIGHAVLDAAGLVGQVVEVGSLTCRVLLVDDLAHATPVLVARNDLRLVLRGTGEGRPLELQHVPDTADLRRGDVLITSGLGGRFPPGYPVAEITEIADDPAGPFAAVTARPLAQLTRSRHMVIVTDEDAVGPPRPFASGFERESGP